jgi:hypothetical protein
VALGASLADWQARVATLQALAHAMKQASRVSRDSQLSEFTTVLFVCVAEMSLHLQREAESYYLTAKDYANREGLSLRTVQRQCRNHKLPAILVDGTWRIRDA